MLLILVDSPLPPPTPPLSFGLQGQGLSFLVSGAALMVEVC